MARAESFTVNSTADNEVDATLGDEICQTAGGKCTLRAAIEEADSLGGFNVIGFEEELFKGQLASTIALGATLPTVTAPTAIEGRTCPTGAGVEGPCVGIDGSSGEPALVVNAEEVEISGLAITGAQTAISIKGSPRTKVRGSWFGVGLDGVVVGNETGVLIAAGSNGAFVGGEGSGQGNVFAGNAADGLDVHGGNGVRVYGNWFGVKPDGVTPSANGGDDIEVVSTEGSEVTETEIGTRVSAAAAASPVCDGGCNVISGAGANGIDLQGESGEVPGTSAAIAGNYIGVDAAGAAAVPNTGAGINVGQAPHTLVGGPSSGETNRIDGGSVGVSAGPAAGDLAIRGNLIGVDASGAGTLSPPDDGIVVNSTGLPSPTLEAEIVGNEIRLEDGVGITQHGQGAWIFGNDVFGAQTGIKTFGSTGAFGNVIEGNLVQGAAASGILLENNLNDVVGNEVLGAGTAGIWIQGIPSKATRNAIGGNAASDENVIDGSAGAAIEISNTEKTDNEIARNRGTGNGGLFIDLIAASPSTEVGPNRGIQPPTFSGSAQNEASGGAKPGATVRVFLKQLSAAGELDSFLGEAVADSSGGWKVTYGAEIPSGSIVAATQTLESSTSELAMAAAGGEEEAEGTEGAAGGGTAAVFGGGVQVVPGSDAQVRPQTRIVSGRPRSRTARFVFTASRAGSTFLCRLDDKPFDICKSPKTYVGLEPGRHVFWVRAIDPAGRVDLSPAKKKFAISS